MWCCVSVGCCGAAILILGILRLRPGPISPAEEMKDDALDRKNTFIHGHEEIRTATPAAASRERCFDMVWMAISVIATVVDQRVVGDMKFKTSKEQKPIETHPIRFPSGSWAVDESPGLPLAGTLSFFFSVPADKTNTIPRSSSGPFSFLAVTPFHNLQFRDQRFPSCMQCGDQ